MFVAVKRVDTHLGHALAQLQRSFGRFLWEYTVRPAGNVDGVELKRRNTWSPADRTSWTLAAEAPAAGPSSVGYTSLSGSQTGIQFVANFSSHCRIGITRNNSVRFGRCVTYGMPMVPSRL